MRVLMLRGPCLLDLFLIVVVYVDRFWRPCGIRDKCISAQTIRAVVYVLSFHTSRIETSWACFVVFLVAVKNNFGRCR